MEIIFNPIVIAVVLLIVLCMLKINVLISLLISAMAAGVLAGMSIVDTMGVLIDGMGGNATTALSYILLGILASGMAYTGITEILSQKISHVVGKNALALVNKDDAVYVKDADAAGTLLKTALELVNNETKQQSLREPDSCTHCFHPYFNTVSSSSYE